MRRGPYGQKGRTRGQAEHIHAVKRGDDGDLLASQASAEGLLEWIHSDDGAHQGTIITVGAGAAECDEDGEV